MNQEQDITDSNVVRSSQILVFGLLSGPIAFALTIFLIGFGGAGARQNNGGPKDLLFPIIGVGIALLMIGVKLVVPQLVVAKARRKWVAQADEVQDFEPEFAPVFQQKTIIGAAPLEGAIFFNLICFIVSGQIWVWGTVGVLYLLLATHFPTQATYDAWKQRQRQLIRDESGASTPG